MSVQIPQLISLLTNFGNNSTQNSIPLPVPHFFVDIWKVGIPTGKENFGIGQLTFEIVLSAGYL